MSFKFRNTLKWGWILTISICLVYYFLNPYAFSKENIVAFVSKYNSFMWTVYFLLHVFRGFVLLPSTPLIFAGILLFPDSPFLVLSISLIGIVFASLLIYFFSDKLGFSSFFNKKTAKINKIEKHLSGKYGYLYIMLWSFIRIVPTDLICYVSGALKIKISTFLISIFIGELILCSIYIYGGLSLLS